jgi:UDP-N-acetylglucosamine--N-acetylmuramyl-(pentapeptide) pyrophosphoryl-undecaprenol N-acetylglucosamine transferase
VCTTFAESHRFFPAGRAVRTGNPVRPLLTTQKPAPNHFTILIFGGSQGAHKLNVTAVGAAGLVAQRIRGLRIIHQTGAADAEWVARGYSETGVAAEVVPFIDDMASAYGGANLVVCRAGATTLAELACVGKPAILVPYPYAADDHQRANAEILARAGAAHVILDVDLDAARLAARIEELATNPEQLDAIGVAVGRFAVPDAATRVVEVCAQLSSAGGGHGAAV